MPEEPTVSVIIPFYNRFDLLEKSLNSVKQQTFTDYEAILVDDGSESPFKLPNNLDNRFKLIHYSVNKGAGFARKKGREIAKGDYIAYLDSDDWWSVNFLEECVEDLDKNQNLAMVYGNTIALQNNKEISRRVNKTVSDTILPILFKNKKRLWATGSCLWRAEFSLAHNWKKLRNNEDFIHDIHVSRLNNHIKFNKNAFLYNNKSAENRIHRDSEEVKKALCELLKIDSLPCYNKISKFIIRRMYDYNLKFELKIIFKIMRVVKKEFGFFSLSFYEYMFYIFYLNYSDGKSFRLKRHFNL